MQAINLRPYQSDLLAAVRAEWASGARAVVMRSETGSGKTAITGQAILDHQGASCVVAHRSELVSQISLTLARYGVRHSLIAAKPTIQAIARAHIETVGQCYYTPGARCAVASIATLVRRKGIEQWAAQVTLAVVDEFHHTTLNSQWHKGLLAFTNPALKILGPTATPERADGKGLGRHADGIADSMVEGPSMRWLIEQGYLTDYIVYCPRSDMVVQGVPGASGDFSTAQLHAAAKKSHIVGDLPAHYLRCGEGGLGISFTTDVSIAIETCEAYRAAGVTAEVLTGETPLHVRTDLIKRYTAGRVRQLCVVDVVSEGFDLPAMRVASFGRPSESRSLVRQQMGRALRADYAPGYDLSTQAGRLAAIAASNKPYAIFIDHVGHFLKPNIGPPDRPIAWSLDRRDKRASTASPSTLRVCVADGCWRPYERYLRACPYCGCTPEPQSRRTPAAVDGDLQLLDADVLEALRGAVAAVDATDGEEQARLAARHVPGLGIMASVKRHRERREAQSALRESMAVWGGWRAAEGLSDVEIQRLFYHTWGVDVLSAQALGAAQADELKMRIDAVVNGS